MKSKSRVLFLCAILSFVLVLMWFSGRDEAIEKTVEVEPWITVPEYRSDAGRVIDAYERMMERYMDVTQEDIGGIRGGVKLVSRKLSSIEMKLDRMEQRLVRIERTMGIKEPGTTPRPAGEKGATKPNTSGGEESKKN